MPSRIYRDFDSDDDSFDESNSDVSNDSNVDNDSDIESSDSEDEFDKSKGYKGKRSIKTLKRNSRSRTSQIRNFNVISDDDKPNNKSKRKFPMSRSRSRVATKSPLKKRICKNHKKREGNAFRYMGGKAAIASDIHDVILEYEEKIIGEEQDYLEPFAGAMSVAFKFALDRDDGQSNRIIMVSDLNNDMVKLWTALKNGKRPPKYVSEKEYNRYKNGNSDMRGYVGSVFAFGGSMFGTYRGRCQSREKTIKEGESSYNKLMKVVPLLDYITIKSSRSYDDWNPKQMTIYCDPPYESTKFSSSNKYLLNFEHEKFWNTMRKWSKNNLVFISEIAQNVPSDFKVIWKKTIKRAYNSRSNNKEKTEILCIHKSKLRNAIVHDSE